MFDRAGNNSEKNPLRLTGKVENIPTPYNSKEFENWLKMVEKVFQTKMCDGYYEYTDNFGNTYYIKQITNINFYLFETTNKSERDISFEVHDTILTDMRSKYISILNETFNK